MFTQSPILPSTLDGDNDIIVRQVRLHQLAAKQNVVHFMLPDTVGPYVTDLKHEAESSRRNHGYCLFCNISSKFNHQPAKIRNLIFHPLEVVSRSATHNFKRVKLAYICTLLNQNTYQYTIFNPFNLTPDICKY